MPVRMMPGKRRATSRAMEAGVISIASTSTTPTALRDTTVVIATSKGSR